MNILYAASCARHIRDFHLPVIRALAQGGHDVTVACRDAGDLDGCVCEETGDGGLQADEVNGKRDNIPEHDAGPSAANDCVLHERKQPPPPAPGRCGRITLVPLPFAKSYFSFSNIKAWYRAFELMENGGYDLISTHTALAGFIVRMAALAVKKTHKRRMICVHTVHGYLFGKKAPASGRVTYPFERMCAGVTDVYLTMNTEDTEHALKFSGRKGGRVIRIPGMGVDAARYAPADPEEKEALRASLGLPEGALLFYAAEFSKRKNHRDIIRAMKRLPSVRLVLAGDGALADKTRRLAMRLGVGDRVLFLGYVEDTAPYLRACDIAVSSSRSEGLPAAVLEALACGLPVIASRVKGHSDILPGENLYPPGRPGKLVKIVKQVDAAGKTPRTNLPPEYHKENAVKSIMEVYDAMS